MAGQWQPVAAGAAAGAGAATAVTLALLQRYLQRELKPPSLHHKGVKEDADDDLRLLQVKLLLRDYWPHPILEFTGYLSTAWSGMWAVLPTHASGKVERLKLRDGGTVSLQWSKPPLNPSNRVVLILPGLNNDSRTSFVQATMHYFSEGGFQAVALNYRGIGGVELTSARVGCADSWRDLNEVIDHIVAARPGAILFAMGFSMGAGLLLRYAGEEGPHLRLRGVVAIAAPVDFPAVGQSLESSFKKLALNFIMVSGVKGMMMRSLWTSEFAKAADFGRALRARTLRQLEEATICRMHGYKDAEDYYTQNSPRPVIGRIAVPTLIVNAEDDPVVSVKTLPLEALNSNPRIYTATTRRGGHIGWGSGGLGSASWTDSMARNFLEVCTTWTSERVTAQSRL